MLRPTLYVSLDRIDSPEALQNTSAETEPRAHLGEKCAFRMIATMPERPRSEYDPIVVPPPPPGPPPLPNTQPPPGSDRAQETKEVSPTKANTEPNVAPQGATREPEFQGGARPEAQATADHREASASARSGAPRGAASSSTRRINILPSRPASVPQPGIAAAMTRDGAAAARAIAGDSTGIATRTDMSLDAPRGASAPSAAAEADGSTAMAVATGGTGLRSQPVEAVVPRAEQVAPQARQQG